MYTLMYMYVTLYSVPMNHYTDGRGNVDKDSDEEEDHGECQEAFQPQYESLPAIRPIQPPEYKPSPSYNNQFSECMYMYVIHVLH